MARNRNKSAAPAARKRAPTPSPAPTPAAAPAPRKGRTAVGVVLSRKYLTRKDVAAHLGVSVKHVIDLVKRGQLPQYDLGPYVKRYLLEDVEAYVQAHRREAFAREAA